MQSNPAQSAVDPIYPELVDLLFLFRLPLVVITVAVAAFGWLIFHGTGSQSALLLTCGTTLLGMMRTLHMEAYRRRRTKGPLHLDEAKRWDNQFATGSILFGLLAGLLCALAIVTPDPQIMSLGYVFAIGYGCGLVSRSGFQARMTIATLTAMMIPIVVAATLRFLSTEGTSVAYELALALFLASFIFGGFETARQSQRVVRDQLTTRRKYYAIARQDALTGAANRRLLAEKFEDAAQGERAGKLALHCIDLDQFKPVNDRYGHGIGDALLVAITGRIAGLLRQEDTLARVGGDEFIILQVKIRSTRQATTLANRVLEALSQPFQIEGRRIQISASVGTMVADAAADFKTTREAADRALYRAKSAGRNRVVVALDAA